MADDESALFYNPAGLGIKNERSETGALSYFDFDFFRENEYKKYQFSQSVATNSGNSPSYKRAFKWSREDRKWWFDK